MTGNVAGFAVLLALGALTALAAYGLLRHSLRRLLDEVVRVPPCTVFYTRLLALGLVFIAASAVLDTAFNLQHAAFMEYVWKVADGLAAVCGRISLFLTAYLLIATILVAVLRRKSD